MSWNDVPGSAANRNRVSLLALIANDASYVTDQSLSTLGGKLRTLPDSAAGDEFFVPQHLAAQVGAVNVPGAAAGVLEVPDWELFGRIQNAATGFQVVVFRNLQTREVIAAFTGSNGPDSTDWYSNLFLGTNQWREDSARTLALIETARSPTIGTGAPLTVHFTGQSLGGALAQYAAYDWLEQNPTFEKSRMTLTTFNGLGAKDGLKDILYNGTYNPGLLSLVKTAHYAIDNDFVHRLGAGM
jgi:hypothetical protein